MAHPNPKRKATKTTDYNSDPITIAEQAEKDVNSYPAKTGYDAAISSNHAYGASDSTRESGVDETVRYKFPGAHVMAPRAQATTAKIPLEEGGDINPKTGKPYKARDLEGAGSPEDKERI